MKTKSITAHCDKCNGRNWMSVSKFNKEVKCKHCKKNFVPNSENVIELVNWVVNLRNGKGKGWERQIDVSFAKYTPRIRVSYKVDGYWCSDVCGVDVEYERVAKGSDECKPEGKFRYGSGGQDDKSELTEYEIVTNFMSALNDARKMYKKMMTINPFKMEEDA